eukprot:3803512-Amphidinium_carterae.1
MASSCGGFGFTDAATDGLCDVDDSLDERGDRPIDAIVVSEVPRVHSSWAALTVGDDDDASQAIPVDANIVSAEGITSEPSVLGATVLPKKRGRPRKLQAYEGEGQSSIAHPSGINVASQGVLCNHSQSMSAESYARQGDVKAKLHVSPTASYDPIVVGGMSTVSVNCIALVACSEISKMVGANTDPDIQSIAAEFCSSPAFNIASLEVLCEKLGVVKSMFQSKLQRLTCAQVVFQKWRRQELEQHLVQQCGQPNLLLCLEHVCFDETPMRVAMVGGITSSGTSNDSSGADMVMPHGENLDVELSKSWLLQSRTLGTACKILQTTEKWAYLIKAGTQMVSIIGKSLCPLQVMQNTTAEVVKACLLANGTSSLYSNQFKCRVKSSCADKAASNKKAMASIAQDRCPGWSSSHMDCEVHIVSTAMKRTFEGVVPEQVSGLLHCALSLRVPGALTVWRSCMRKVIRSSLVIMDGVPSLAARNFKQAAMHLFMSDASTTKGQQALLARLPNGDWRLHDRVELYRASNSTASTDQLAATLENGLIYCLCSRQPHVYPKHRWTGSDISISELGKLEIIHGLLTRTYKEFMTIYTKAGRGITKKGAHVEGGVDTTTDDIGTHALGHEASAVATEWLDEQGSGMATSLASSESAQVGGVTAAQQNSKDRQCAQAWLDTKPLAHIIVLRICVDPILKLLYRMFEVSGINFEVRERALVAHSLANGDGYQRSYMLTLAAKGTLEAEYFLNIKEMLRDSNLFGLVDSSALTIGFRAKCFILLMRQAAAIHELIAHKHQQFPFKMYRLLDEPHLGPSLANTPSCLLDPWSADMIDSYPTLSSPALRPVLTTHCQISTTNISHIEALHASVRRNLHKAPQTWCPVFPTVSAEYVCQCMRRAATSPLYGFQPPKHSGKMKKVH